ncbi:hypothetical protein MBLNU459_g8335t1, partial [Dothideomycetes sp. NU459]
MASRFHQQRDSARSSLFSGYDQQSRSRPTSASPAPGSRASAGGGGGVGGGGYGYGYNAGGGGDGPSSAFSAYPGSGGGGGLGADHGASGTFRTATPNNKGQYSDAVLSELESQNDDQVSEMSRKVAMLKD